MTIKLTEYTNNAFFREQERAFIKGKEEEREDEEGMRKRKGQQGRLTFLPWKPCVHFQNSNLRFSWKRKRLGFFCMLDCVIFFFNLD